MMLKRISILALLSATALASYAQKGNIGFIYPAGAQKGTSVEVTIGGQNISRATGIIVSGEGVSGELLPSPKLQKQKKSKKNIGEEDNLQLADQVRFRIDVSPDAEPGIRDLRLVLPEGISNRLYFEIGQLKDIYEDPAAGLSAESGTLPVTFNGQIMRSDTDRFRFCARKGQQLVIQVKGRIFVPYMADAVPGWFQPTLRLFGPDGVECAYNDDYTFHVDPVIFYEVPQTGNYEIEIADALYRGRGDFVYRVDVGELPFVTGISPLGARPGKKVNVRLEGYNLKASTLKFKAGKEGLIMLGGVSRDGLQSNRLPFEVSPLEEIPAENNFSKEKSVLIKPGQVCEKHFSSPMEQHWYCFKTDEKTALSLNVTARHLDSPADVRMTVYDSDMKVIRDVDDVEDPDDYLKTHFADPRLSFSPSPGTYYVRLVESQAKSGAGYAYRFSISASQPDFSLHIEPATVSIPEGGTAVFNVLMTPKQNFHGAVDIDIKGLPDGFKTSGARIEAGRKKTLVSVTVPEGTQHGTFSPKVTGTASAAGGPAVTRDAVPAESMMQAFYYIHLMPMDDFRMEVVNEQPFKVEAGIRKEPFRIPRSGKVSLPVRIIRNPGFSAPVTIMIKSSDPFVKAEAVVIPENENEGVLELYLTGKLNFKNAMHPRISIYGVVKGSSKKIAGKARNAYVASASAYSPVFIAEIPGTRKK